MTATSTFVTPSISTHTRRLMPLLLVLFIGSGCSALIYEIVWLQLLQLVVGSSAISLGILLGTFMGGMCLGSLLLPRLVKTTRHPLRVYAMLELGIGLIGIGVLYGLPFIDQAYVSAAGAAGSGIFGRGLVGAICLLPPTLLMGATLPAIARWVESTPEGMSWLGFFYGGNIAGAVAGCLIAGFYLLRVFDMETATYVAAAINGSVAVAAFVLSKFAAHDAPSKTRMIDAEEAGSSLGDWVVYLAIGLSGLSALGAEVVWTRLLSLLLGGTVYTFSIILAVFLVGLGIGSTIGAAIARSARRPIIALGTCQLLLAAGIFWTASVLCRSLPFWPINPGISNEPWVGFQLDLMRCAWAVLPPTLLWGASFPIALAAVASRGKDPGRVVGGVYAANTIGAIVGALLFSAVLISWKGTQFAQQTLIAIAAGAALLMLIYGWWSTQPLRAILLALLVGTVGFATFEATRYVIRAPDSLFLWGRYSASTTTGQSVLYVGEGRTSTIAVSKIGSTISFHVAGKIEASTEPRDMRLQRMLGHMPALFHPNPKSVLVVGCGAGVTAGSFVLHPEVKRIVICEIEPLIPENVSHKYFSAENYGVVHDPRVEIVYDDARHYILTTREKFDIITSDPIHPWVKGAATLYTREYFDLCKKRLNPGGICGQWVPLYESEEGVVKSEVATFVEAFPNSTIWSNDLGGAGYDVILLGQAEPMKINLDQMQARIGNLDHPELLESLVNVEFHSAVELCATYGGRGQDLTDWMKHAQINRDRNLRLQYLAGLSLNAQMSDNVYKSMTAHRPFPEGLFIGSPERMQRMRDALTPSAGSGG